MPTSLAALFSTTSSRDTSDEQSFRVIASEALPTSLDRVALSFQQEAPDMNDVLIQFNRLGRPQGVFTGWNASITSPITHARYRTNSLVPFRLGIANRTPPR